jgi:hypothetical protein
MTIGARNGACGAGHGVDSETRGLPFLDLETFSVLGQRKVEILTSRKRRKKVAYPTEQKINS